MYDVVVMGGGLAGLSLSIQLKRKNAELSIAVIEKESHPVPLAAHKVGEATVEIGGHYFYSVVGMADHLRESQLLKPGLRFFLPSGDNSDIAKRGEFGHSHWPEVPAYQLDRGVFENALAERAKELGVDFLDQASIDEVDLDGERGHRISYTRNGETHVVTGDWVVDASGRAALLRKKLGLHKPSPHHCGSVWFRVKTEIDIDQWSDDPEWRGRVEPNLRRYATNHLMGEGYWVWIIPLSSGATSIGIVVDPDYHSIRDMRDINMALDWLRAHEPQCAKVVEENLDKVLDFKVLANFSNDCDHVYSDQKYLITGVAGPFLDPFYSPGSDFIALGNTFITDIITKDKQGEDVEVLIQFYNEIYLSIFRSALNIYDHQYQMWGNPQVMICKLTWDYSYYWGVFALLFFNDKFTDVGFLLTVIEDINRIQKLGAQMQGFLREWSKRHKSTTDNFYVDQFDIDYLYEFHKGMGKRLEDGDLRKQIKANVDTCEKIAQWMMREALGVVHPGTALPQAAAIDPYTFSFDSVGQPVAASGESEVDVDGLGKIWVAA